MTGFILLICGCLDSAYYVIGIPFGLWLTFSRDFGLVGLWLGLTVSLVYAAGIGVYICLNTDWTYQVEKVRIRLAADQKAGMRQDVENATN